jgi:hypothetical protein
MSGVLRDATPDSNSFKFSGGAPLLGGILPPHYPAD